MGDQGVGVAARLDHTGPFHQQWHAVPALVGGALLPIERRGSAIRPTNLLRAIVGGVDDDGVVGDAQVIEFFQQLTNLAVVLDHTVRIQANAGLAIGFLAQVGPDMHAGAVEPDEERLVSLVCLVDEVPGGLDELVVDGFHTLAGQWAGVLDLAVGIRVDHPARAVLFPELRVFRIVVSLWFFLGIHVVEIAEELVETVLGRQVLVAVAHMVLAELPGRIALLLHHIANGGRPIRDAMLGAGHANGQQPGAKRMLAEEKSRASGGTGLLAVGMGEQRAFFGDAIDVRRFVTHHALVVGTEIGIANVIAEDHQNVGTVGGGGAKDRAHH
ncbi:hypothetical protein D3C85_1087290 [compost metagenome]